jgi:hypothetical protein
MPEHLMLQPDSKARQARVHTAVVQFASKIYGVILSEAAFQA